MPQCIELKPKNQQQLSNLINNQDLESIRAAVAQEPGLLTKKDLRTKQSPLFDAIQSGHNSVVGLLLELGAPTDALNARKQTPLHFALTRGKPEIIKTVLAKTKNVNQPDGRQRATSLMYVIIYRNGDPELLKGILEKGADINLKNSRKQTALHIACSYSNVPAAKVLISAGADLNSQDNNSNTPLLAACTSSPALVSEMLAKGAGPRGRIVGTRRHCTWPAKPVTGSRHGIRSVATNRLSRYCPGLARSIWLTNRK